MFDLQFHAASFFLLFFTNFFSFGAEYFEDCRVYCRKNWFSRVSFLELLQRCFDVKVQQHQGCNATLKLNYRGTRFCFSTLFVSRCQFCFKQKRSTIRDLFFSWNDVSVQNVTPAFVIIQRCVVLSRFRPICSTKLVEPELILSNSLAKFIFNCSIIDQSLIKT